MTKLLIILDMVVLMAMVMVMGMMRDCVVVVECANNRDDDGASWWWHGPGNITRLLLSMFMMVVAMVNPFSFQLQCHCCPLQPLQSRRQPMVAE